MQCPQPDQLQQLLDETLPLEEQTPVQAHLDTCTICQRVIERLAAGGVTWDKTAQNLAEAPASEEGALADKLAKLEDTPTSAIQTQAESVVPPADEDLSFLHPPQRPGSLGRLDEFEVLSVLGKGGFGIVLKAFDENLHRVVALKVMLPHLAANGQARQRFDREAKAAAAISHENVVTIHKVQSHAKTPYLVMQFVSGLTLNEKIDKAGALGLKEVLRIGMQIAEGLAAAQKQGLIHRDIKPGNILLENGIERVKITDFGLARTADDASVTQSGTVAGTPMYMSPEQANGEVVDHRSDLFSLGSVLYVMCTGRPPFRATSTMAVMKRVCDDTPTPVQQVNADIPYWLGDIVRKLHAKKPGDRFQTAKEVAELLGQHLANSQNPTWTAQAVHTATMTMPAPKPQHERWRPVFSRRHLIAVLPFLAGLFVVGVIVFVKYFKPGESNPTAPINADQVLKRMVGIWSIESQTDDANAKIPTGKMRCELIANGKFLRAYTVYEKGGENLTIYGFDPQTKKFRRWFFASDGGLAGIQGPQEGQWDGRASILMVHGDLPLFNKVRNEDLWFEPNYFETRTTVTDHQGQEAVRQLKKMRRLPGDEPVGPTLPTDPKRPVEHALLDRMVGAWKTNVTVTLAEMGDRKVNSQATTEDVAILGGRFVESRERTQPGDREDYVIFGYDEHRKTYRFWHFGADGSMVEADGTLDKKENKLTWKSLDGRLNGAWTFTDIDERRMTMAAKDAQGWRLYEVAAISTRNGAKRLHLEGAPKLAGWDEVVNSGGAEIKDMKGRLHMTLPASLAHLHPKIDQSAPRALKVVHGDFTAQVQLFAGEYPNGKTPGYVGAGLLIWQDDRNYLTWLRGFNETGKALLECPFYEGDAGHNAPTKTIEPTAIQLRLQRRGAEIRASYSQDGGVTWKDHFTFTNVKLPSKVKVGVVAINNSRGAKFHASFENFRLIRETEPAWVPLFNGKDLTGWNQPDWSNPWHVVDGILVGKVDEKETRILSSTRGDYENFHLRAEVLAKDLGHNGICFRAEPLKYKGYVAEVTANSAGINGSLLLAAHQDVKWLHTAKSPLIGPDDWIVLEIIAQGKEITTRVNGQEAARITDATIARGHVSLAVQGNRPGDGKPTKGGSVIHFRKIEIKELPAEEPAWVQLFNGKDLTGWKTHPDQPGNWKVKDGILTGRGNTSHLFSDGRYYNFRLRAEVMIEQGYSGIYFRAGYNLDHFSKGVNRAFPIGHEAQINAVADGPRTGSLKYAPVKKSLMEPGKWFTLEIIAENDHLVTMVNGEKAADRLEVKERFQKGHLALQCGGSAIPNVVHFRKIEIKEPKTAPPVPSAEAGVLDYAEIHDADEKRFDAWIAQMKKDGYRPVNLSVQTITDTPRYTAIALKEAAPKSWEFARIKVDDDKHYEDMRGKDYAPVAQCVYRDNKNLRQANLWVHMPNANIDGMWLGSKETIDKKIAEAKKRKARPVFRSAFEGAAVVYDVILAGTDKAPWTETLGLSAEVCKLWIEKQKGLGWRPDHLYAYGAGATTEFGAILIQDAAGPDWDISWSLTPAQYEAELTSRKTAGFRPRTAVAHDDPAGARRFSVIWVRFR